METVRVRFEPSGAVADVAVGTTVHEAAALAGVTLDAPCGGLGRCGGCRVRSGGGLFEPRPSERAALSPADLAGGWRLACMARVAAPATVQVGPADETSSGPSEVAASGGRGGLGAAIDVGTTTLAAALVDLADGRVVGTASALNPQVAFGHDVLSRVGRAIAGDGDALLAAVTGELHRLVGRLLSGAGASDADLVDVVVVGNPAMVHLLIGRDPSPLVAPPYTGALVSAVDAPAGAVGLGGASATVHIPPAMSAFVGADAVAASLAAGLDERADPVLLADLGTNGEVVLAARGALYATSAAAGPALEGASISSGMRAQPGAIDRVRLVDDRLEVGTVDGSAATGVCGSGLIDAIAALLDAGALDRSGRLVAHGVLASLVRETEQGTAVELAPKVTLTQHDIREVQLAKGALAVAAAVLLEEADITADAVREVVVAGAFGSHVSPAALVRLGVIPPEWRDRVTFAGNAALDGAVTLLLDPRARERARALAQRARTVPLATRQDFQRRFLAALDFPDPL